MAYDPLDDIDSLLRDPVAYSSRRKRKKQEKSGSLPALSPEERQSLAGQLGSGVISGISAVGNLLDLPGSMVRDTLAGQNPIDQWLSPFTASNRTTGRDLLRKYGAVGREDTTPNWWGGLASEIILDPLTYATFGAGALTKAGTLAKNAGILAKATRAASKAGKGARALRVGSTLDEIIGLAGPGAREAAEATAKGMGVDLTELGTQKIGGLMGVQTPFAREAAGVFGQGPMAEKIAGGLDTVGHAVRYGKYSPIRPIAPLFDHRISGTTEQQQKLSLDAFYNRQEAKAAARSEAAPLYRKMLQSGQFDMASKEGQDNLQHMRRALEGVREVPAANLGSIPGEGNVLAYQGGRASATDLLPDHLKGWGSTIESLRQKMPKMLMEERDMGLKTPELQDFFADYFPRGRQETGGLKGFVDNLLGRGSKILDSTHPYQKQRQLRNIPGGSEAIDRMRRDPVLVGVGRNRQKYSMSQNVKHLSQNYQVHSLAPGEQRKLVDYLANLDPSYAKEQKSFWEHPIDSLMKREERGILAKSNAKIVQDTLAEFASAQDGPGMVGIKSALRNAGLTPKAYENVLSKLGVDMGDEVPNFFVPKQVADDVGRLMQTFTAPDEAKAAVRAIDAFTNAFKLGVTSPFPGFHARNFVSGQFNNFIAGAFSPTSVKQAHQLLGGAVEVEGLGKVLGISDDRATRALADELFAHGVFDPGQGPLADAVPNIAQQIPGMVPITQVSSAKDAVKTAGRSIGSYVEGLNRVAPYIELRRQGVAPAEAAKRVFAAQVDYRGLSQFEKSYMRRVAPFYTFSRKIAPFVFQELMERPGGRLAQTVRATNRGRGDDLVPEQVSSTAAMPIGGELPLLGKVPEGFQRYLTGFGLAHEDPLGLVRPGANSFDTAKKTIQELLGRTNPLVKAPLELGFGIQAFSGRDMRDLDPGLGRIIANVSGSKEPANTPELVEQLLANSPASRALTTVRTLTDTRKGRRAPAALNLLTGVRVSDVDMAKAEKTALRERLEDKLRGRAGVRTFESYYSPDTSTLSPNDALLMSLYRSQLNEAQAAKRKPKKKKAKKNRTVEDLIGDLLP